MRWASKPLPEQYARRIVRRFALFPTRMVDSGAMVWLTGYWHCQSWLNRSEGNGGWWFGKGNVEDVNIAKSWQRNRPHQYAETVPEFMGAAD